MIYLDAAYIAKFYVDEPDSERCAPSSSRRSLR